MALRPIGFNAGANRPGEKRGAHQTASLWLTNVRRADGKTLPFFAASTPAENGLAVNSRLQTRLYAGASRSGRFHHDRKREQRAV